MTYKRMDRNQRDRSITTIQLIWRAMYHVEIDDDEPNAKELRAWMNDARQALGMIETVLKANDAADTNGYNTRADAYKR